GCSCLMDDSLTGLCVGQSSWMTDETLPKPFLNAWPSWIMPPKSNVTLQCHTSTKNVNFVLRKGRSILESLQSLASTEGMAEFHLNDLKTRNAGPYTCKYYRRELPQISSQPSDILLLLVTGEFPKPSLQAPQRGVVTAGETVTLQCQRPDNIFMPIKFALLKAGAAEPIRVQDPAGKETDFSLRSVTVSDAGNYSCVYFQIGAPFLTSQPSNFLEIQVRGSFPEWLHQVTFPPTVPRRGDYTTGNLIRLGLAAIIVVIMGAFLVEAWCSQKEPPRGSV
uniref:Ig-like domain-containing protein n=1 Tax=Canis lupus dingo TaxID=286419 RepID=A0A8C0R3H2_CANLU